MMMETLCSPNNNDSSSKDILVGLLQESIEHVEVDEHHPVLYQALAALHEYIGCQQERLMATTATSAVDPASFALSARRQRSSFQKSINNSSEHVVASGWLELLTNNSTENQQQNGASDISRETVLLLLVVPEGDDEPNLQIARDTISSSIESKGSNNNDSSNQLEKITTIPILSLLSCQYVDLYGDPRLILRVDGSSSALLLRCDSAAAAAAWVSELEDCQRHQMDNDDAVADGEPALADTNTTTNTYALRTRSEEFLVDQSVEVGVDEYIIPKEGSDDDGVGSDDIEDDTIASSEELDGEPEVAEEGLPTESNNTQVKATQVQPSPPNGKQEAEEKAQELENVAKATTVAKAAPNNPNPPATTAPVKATSPHTRAAAQIPTIAHPPLVKLTVEQQKKLASDRRRQDMELQRKLARTDQRRKELQTKRKFMEQEVRKQELVAKVQAQRSTTTTGAGGDNASNITLVALHQIHQRLEAFDKEIKQKEVEYTQLQAEIEKRKNQPLHNFAVTADSNPTVVQQQRMAEQARKEKTLEEQKKAAADKRRQELEAQRRRAREDQKRKDETKKRRFLEQEQRKQDLMAKAKLGGGGEKTDATDSILLKKLSSQMTALEDEEVERKRLDDIKKAEREVERMEAEAEEEEMKDPEIARKSIAEQARQRELQEETNSSAVSPSMQHRKHQQQNGATSPQSQYSGHPLQSPNTHSQYQQQHAQRTIPQSPRGHHQPQYQQHPTSPPQSWSSPQNPTSPRQAKPQRQPQSQPTPAATVPPNAHHPKTGTDQKYSKMVEPEPSDDGEPNFLDLKRKIIVGWALQPPNMDCLRPIDQLLRTVEAVYPPSHGVQAHSYFEGWKPIGDKDLLDATTDITDEKKLSKAVRKLRFFLHPDKLPRDLSDEQGFMCKILWDVTNDAWEDHKKAQEDLDWMN